VSGVESLISMDNSDLLSLAEGMDITAHSRSDTWTRKHVISRSSQDAIDTPPVPEKSFLGIIAMNRLVMRVSLMTRLVRETSWDS
jgi:hypothetical protein